MVVGTKQLTKSCNLKSRINLQCVVDSWNMIPSDMVIRSFLMYGISNSLDGMQVDKLFSEFVGNCQESTCQPEDIPVTVSDYDAGIYKIQVQQTFLRESDDEEFDGS